MTWTPPDWLTLIVLTLGAFAAGFRFRKYWVIAGAIKKRKGHDNNT